MIYLTAEDGIGDTLKKRMRVCGANMDNIATVPNKKTQLLFDDPEIEEYMRNYKPDLMIFDPFQAYIGSDIDMNAPNKTSEKMGHLVELAEKYNVWSLSVTLIKMEKAMQSLVFWVQLILWDHAVVTWHWVMFRVKMM